MKRQGSVPDGDADIVFAIDRILHMVMWCARMRPDSGAKSLLFHSVTVLFVLGSALLRCWDCACSDKSCNIMCFVSPMHVLIIHATPRVL